MGASVKTGDRILIAVLIAVTMAGALWFAVGGNWDEANRHAAGSAEAGTGAGPMVVCQTKSGFYRADPLSSTAEYTVETPGTAVGADAESGENTVRIKDGEVDVIEANCSNQVCVEHDPIDQPGEQIVCLPHGLVVEVVQDEDDASQLM